MEGISELPRLAAQSEYLELASKEVASNMHAFEVSAEAVRKSSPCSDRLQNLVNVYVRDYPAEFAALLAVGHVAYEKDYPNDAAAAKETSVRREQASPERNEAEKPQEEAAPKTASSKRKRATSKEEADEEELATKKYDTMPPKRPAATGLVSARQTKKASSKRKRAALKQEADEEQLSDNEDDTRSSRRAPGTRPIERRQAIVRAMAFYMQSFKVDHVKALIHAAGITATLLPWDVAQYEESLQIRTGGKNPKIVTPATGWPNEEAFEKAQLHFFLGRALLEQFDLIKRERQEKEREGKPKAKKAKAQGKKVPEPDLEQITYGHGTFQDLWVGKDVNGNSRLALAMMNWDKCSMHPDPKAKVIDYSKPRDKNGKHALKQKYPDSVCVLPHDAAYIRDLLHKAADYECKKTKDRGHCKVGCVLAQELDRAERVKLKN
jgi:hypothetical protein